MKTFLIAEQEFNEDNTVLAYSFGKMNVRAIGSRNISPPSYERLEQRDLTDMIRSGLNMKCQY